jgi:hypothetical protein
MWLQILWMAITLMDKNTLRSSLGIVKTAQKMV